MVTMYKNHQVLEEKVHQVDDIGDIQRVLRMKVPGGWIYVVKIYVNEDPINHHGSEILKCANTLFVSDSDVDKYNLEIGEYSQ